MRSLSVIINNYNYARFLRQAAESVLAELDDGDELIVVDDGSTDESREILKEFEGRTKVILQENAGQAAALNRGFAHSSGEWVLFLDADDFLLPGWGGRLKPIFAGMTRETRLQFPLEARDLHGLRLGLNPADPARMTQGNAAQHLLRHHSIEAPPTSGNCLRRAWLTNVMPIPHEAFRLCADLYLAWVDLRQQEAKSFVEPLGVYRIHETNHFFRQSSFDLDPPRAEARIRAVHQQLNLLQDQQILGKEATQENYAREFLSFRTLKELLLARRFHRADVEALFAPDFLTHLAEEKAPSTAKKLERMNLFLTRFAPIFFFPWIARLENWKKRHHPSR